MRSRPRAYSPSQTNILSSCARMSHCSGVSGMPTLATPSFGIVDSMGSLRKTSRFCIDSGSVRGFDRHGEIVQPSCAPSRR